MSQFKVGDSVKIKSGEYRGYVGTIVKTPAEFIHLIKINVWNQEKIILVEEYRLRNLVKFLREIDDLDMLVVLAKEGINTHTEITLTQKQKTLEKPLSELKKLKLLNSAKPPYRFNLLTYCSNCNRLLINYDRYYDRHCSGCGQLLWEKTK